ncbi:hypothetical protein [Streptomyces sp. NPDC059649]|uniref:hypothetical protein n=1 Tax=Streptomyces sp. NPDC059649 TaxID=3346895 RepID=UPI0036C3BCFE
MTDRDGATSQMLGGLLSGSHLTTPGHLSAKVAEQAAVAGLLDVLIYVCDVQQRILRLFPRPGVPAAHGCGGDTLELSVDSTLAGRAFQHAPCATTPPCC